MEGSHAVENQPILHTCYGKIHPLHYARIIRYTQDDITPVNFRRPKTWWPRLKDILLYHPDPLVRHEVPFVLTELGSRTGLEPLLVQVVKFDESVIVKHEALEALGHVVEASDIYAAYVQIGRMLYLPPCYDSMVSHPDVQATARTSFTRLERKLRRLDPSIREQAHAQLRRIKDLRRFLP